MPSSRLRRVIALALALSAIAASVAVSAPPKHVIDAHLVRTLERRFAPALVADWSHVTGLVVAGGSTARAAEAVRLAQDHPHLKIVITGPGEPEIAAVAQADGISGSQILVDRLARNTYENAVMSKSLAAPRAGERWLLVTSAAHMPRAIGSFYAVGFHVEPWPVADGELANAAHVAAHEWLGLVVYWLRGRTIALFPGRDHLEIARRRG